jgi:bifunctional DNA-binding transcriptional regulator/antitoxin component of YhaV-PrlF toxin-antitoxin module
MKVVTPTVQTKDVKISSKGQITLPKAFLDQMDLCHGQSVIIQFAQDRLEIINKQNNLKHKIKKLAGSISPKVKSKLTIEDQIESAKINHYKTK